MTAPLAADSPEVTAAVKWWTDILGKNTPSTVGDAQVDMMLDLTRAVSGAARPTDEQVAAFEAELTKLVAQDHARSVESGSTYNTVILSVDYHPEDLLRSALAAAGISEQSARFPVKTVMWVDAGRVTLRKGYGADETTLL